jgi:hypothetical protein
VDTLEVVVRVVGFAAALSATIPSLLYARKRAHDVAQGQLLEVRQDVISAQDARITLLETTVESRDDEIERLQGLLADARSGKQQ